MKISLRMREDNNREQQCNGCNACCTVLAIAELDKPIYSHCQHECKAGCGIYGKHPEECQSYWCFFIGGMFGKDIAYRPDKLGLIFDFRGTNSFQFLQCWETRPNAYKEPRGENAIQALLKRFPIVVRRYNLPLSKVIILGGKDATEKITRFLVKNASGIDVDKILAKIPELS
jgi:hypothetical protein